MAQHAVLPQKRACEAKLLCYYTLMEFEYDLKKSASNFEKHGVDFEQAQGLWADEQALVVAARSTGEERFAIIARWEDKVWTCIFTLRDGRTRIISVRRVRDEEKEKYN